jgi:2'-5' RNA ligase
MKIQVPFLNKTIELAEPAKPSKGKMTDEVGVAGEVVFTGFKDEEARADKTTIQTYRDMLDKDPTVESLYNIFTLPVIAATYRIDADENDNAETQAEFVRKNLLEPPHKGGMELPFSLFLDQLLLSVVDGFQLWERVYRIDDEGHLALKKLAHRDSIGLTLKRDKYGGYAGAAQRVNYMGEYKDIELEAYKTFLFTHNKARSFLYGRSAFKSLYPKYDKKKRLEYLDSISLQNDAIKAKLLKRTEQGDLGKEGKKARDKALSVLSKLGETKPVGSIPYGFDVDVISAEGRSPHESIERQNSEMARAFLATFALLGSQGKSSNVGSYALSDNLADMLMTSIKGFMTKIEEHINQYLIADLIDLNFADKHYPEFHFDDITSDVVEVMTESFQKLLEKDKISDEMVQGIEEAAANRLEIDLDAIRKQREKQAKKDEKEAARKAAESEEENGPQLSDISSRNFPGLYDGLVNEDKLGCIMLNLQTFDVRPHVEDADADLYATDEAHSGGAVAETEAHVTLLYGLLQNGNTIKDKVDKVLDGINIESVTINDVGSFEVEADAPSVPIVAYVSSNSSRGLYYDGDNKLKQAHDRLALLPHVNTFGDYVPHVTLAYVKNDPDIVQKWVKALGDKLRGMRIGATGINYGDLPEEDDDDEGGAAGSGGKFLSDVHWHRDLTEAEKTVKFAEINERMDTLEQQFVDSMKPITEKLTGELVDAAIATKSPLKFDVTLPADYGKTIMATIKTAFNYGKITAADEDGVAAPATAADHVTKMREQSDFVVDKQQDDLKNLIRSELLTAQRTNALAEGDEQEGMTAEEAFKAGLAATIAKWFEDKLKATAGAIVPQGINDGRGATFDATAEDTDIYQWSAILDGKCTLGICPPLDGLTISRAEYLVTRWKPKLHWNCRCLLVRIRKLPGSTGDVAIPDVTGFPLTSGGYRGPII